MNLIKVLMAEPWISVRRLQSVTKEVVVPLKSSDDCYLGKKWFDIYFHLSIMVCDKYL